MLLRSLITPARLYLSGSFEKSSIHLLRRIEGRKEVLYAEDIQRVFARSWVSNTFRRALGVGECFSDSTETGSIGLIDWVYDVQWD